MRRELAGEDALAGLLGALEEVLGVALLLADPPDAAAHQEVVEDVGADVERVVLFQQFGEAGVGLA